MSPCPVSIIARKKRRASPSCTPGMRVIFWPLARYHLPMIIELHDWVESALVQKALYQGGDAGVDADCSGDA
ncbi:hypothetical protein C2W62_09180 [Candidatus Entotheonella serta]|nr:hypothetical protein C2W62_09180 [Candidatus Entotheonella serta]